MSEFAAISFDNLSKFFGRGEKRVEAVKNLNLSIDKGQVYGFLGPNGAGKTTTIRMMVSLILPTQGAVYIYGQQVHKNHDVLKRVGALVEEATFYNFLSGRKNLEVLSRTANNYQREKINLLLEQVGLADRADRPVKSYSTGMKQRLGVAAALLGDPDLVILDEPTNGLDPAGIREMRSFIRSLAVEQGKTVFLSSHLLTEVEQVCDRVAIINKGEIVREGLVSDLLAGKSELYIDAKPLDKAVQMLTPAWHVSISSERLVVRTSQEDIPNIVRELVRAEINIYQVIMHKQTLEEYFMNVTDSGDEGSGV